MAERGNSDPQHQAAEAPKAQSTGGPWTSLQQRGHLQPAQALLPSKLHITVHRKPSTTQTLFLRQRTGCLLQSSAEIRRTDRSWGSSCSTTPLTVMAKLQNEHHH